MTNIVELMARAEAQRMGCAWSGMCDADNTECDCRANIRATLTALQDAGYAIVPVEPTDDMMAAVDCVGEKRKWLSGRAWEAGYRAMIAATPKVM